MAKFQRKPAHERKLAILKAALPFFAQKGFAATTTREITRAAGVSDALLYKYFPSKESIYKELIEFCASRVEHIGLRLEAQEKTTPSFIRSVFFLMFVIRFGDPSLQEYKRSLDRLLVQDLLSDGAMMRSFHLDKLAPWIEKLNEQYLAVIALGDSVTPRADSLTRLWFADKLAFIMMLLNLPGENTVKFAQDEGKVFADLVLFALRGLGLTEQALHRHFNADELYAFVQTMFAEEALTTED